MLKLLFWGLIGYVVYSYFQRKAQLHGGRHRDYMQHPPQGSWKQEQPRPSSHQNDGEFIDYEEIK